MRLIDADELKKCFCSEGTIIDTLCCKIIDLQPTIATATTIEATWNPWEANGYADGYPVYDSFMCSNCEEIYYDTADGLPDYCPNCGAKMEINDEPYEEDTEN
jgi:hypothetical protein